MSPNKNIQLKFSKIILIGGGELLLYTATVLKKKKNRFFNFSFKKTFSRKV